MDFIRSIFKYLLEEYKKLYAEWVDVSPEQIKLEKDDTYFKGMSLTYFFIEFSIPWILKWTIEVQKNEEGFPCLKRKFHIKFWSKLLQRDAEEKVHGWEIIDSIHVSIEVSTGQAEVIYDREDISLFKHITRKLQMKKCAISESEILASYMEEVKKELIKNMGIETSDNISIATSMEEEDTCLADEAKCS